MGSWLCPFLQADHDTCSIDFFVCFYIEYCPTMKQIIAKNKAGKTLDEFPISLRNDLGEDIFFVTLGPTLMSNLVG